MEALFKDLQSTTLADHKKDQGSSHDTLLYEQIVALEHHNESLKAALKKWSEWYQEHHPDSHLPIADVEEPSPIVREPEGPQAQPFVLTSDKGQYMVLHRMNEVAPPEVGSWLKQNGAQSFNQFLSSITKPVYFSPPSPGMIDFHNITPDMAKRFVHNFFN